MPEDRELTGIDELDRDLAQLFALADDSSRLEEAKSAIADENASLEKLTSVMGVSVMEMSLALSDPQNAQELLEQMPESGRLAVEEAIAFIKTHLAGIEKHPSVVRAMRKELAQKTGKQDNLKNRISRLKWDTFWQEKKGKLLPTARLSFLDERNELLLDSTLDWEDLAFVMRSCARILVSLCQKSELIAKANLLDLSYAQRLSERIAGTRSALDELPGPGSILGIDLSKSAAENGAPDPPSNPTDSQ